jgi:hypothetical protein
MEKVTLDPGTWTPFDFSRFQVIGQHNVRIGIGSGTGPVNGDTYEPPAADAAYFTTQGYDPKIVNVLDLLGASIASPNIYLMPDANHSVDVVAL